MDLSDLERLIEMVKHADVRELTLREGNARITIRKAETEPAETAVFAHLPDRSDWVADSASSLETARTAAEEGNPAPVLAMRVGVFRHVKPMLGVGARVNEGQVIGHIEAMKVVTEVLASAAGQIVDVQAEDGQPVEYGQPLFLIRI